MVRRDKSTMLVKPSAMKPTKFMPNSWYIIQELDKRCDGGHSHQPLVGGRAKEAAQVYPDGLCRAICRGWFRKEQIAVEMLYPW